MRFLSLFFRKIVDYVVTCVLIQPRSKLKIKGGILSIRLKKIDKKIVNQLIDSIIKFIKQTSAYNGVVLNV